MMPALAEAGRIIRIVTGNRHEILDVRRAKILDTGKRKLKGFPFFSSIFFPGFRESLLGLKYFGKMFV